MLRKIVPAVALAAVLAALAAAPALAGWKIREADPEFREEVTTYWFQGGKARVEGALEGLTVLIDLKAQEGWLVDAASKRYAGGKIADLAEQLKKLEEQGTSPEESGAKGEEAEPEAEFQPVGPRAVTIKDLGAGDKLLGYETRHYEVSVDKEVLEELWIAPKVDVEREIDLTAFVASMQKMLGGGTGMNQGYEDNPDYLKLRRSGYPLKQILYFVGEKSTLEALGAESAAIPDADFAPPKGFAKVGYVELLVGEGGE